MTRTAVHAGDEPATLQVAGGGVTVDAGTLAEVSLQGLPEAVRRLRALAGRCRLATGD